ncbi:putative alpha-mannosidase [Sesamum angolense]|uniref:Alpha-mannosidase n=1 Tax=Sesamum angolense TaxID=2727404 RepID=A0AAE2C6Q6_9LAMI|nr:putative alpha-mannosidase [Sesamum angolense]
MVYNTSQGIVPGKINVHLVPHTHDDVGWLKTVDQYYVGSNNSIQGACVQNVLDSLIPSLLADKNRKFVYVEQAFFQRWWRQQSEAVKKIVQLLVSSGQLELINGGWCMHDEAATHYIDMIDQTTLGHKFIKEQFNVTPRIGWQIDPFGHSAVQAYLLGAEVGFDALFFGRIDYQDRAKRRDEKKLEVIWQGSKSHGSSSQVNLKYLLALSIGNYEPPTGFYFEVNDDSPVVQDDINLFDYNVQERVNDFVAAAFSQANVTRSNHVMWTMGTDFKYQYAETWFRNMDKLIHYVNQDGRVNALYSTPSLYTDAKHALNESWPLKTDDYFPYADRINAYWTGYFTSRPAIKGYVRMMSGYYLAARQLEFFRGRSKSGPTTDSLADALAIAQHHDAVTGTEKQHVANDYAKRLSIGYKECPLLNISYCPASEVDLSLGKKLVVLVYNSLGWKRTGVVRIPVINDNIVVKDSTGKLITSQFLPIVDALTTMRKFYTSAYTGEFPSTSPMYWLAFTAMVPPVGFSTYVISSASASIKPISYVFDGSQTSAIEIGSGNLKLIYSGDNGKLMQYTNSRSLVNISLEQSYIYYAGDDGKKDLQITRVYKEKEHAEIEFVVGPIPIDDGIGKEIVTQIKTKIGNYKTFYTDSNGRDFLERIRDYRADWDLQVNQPIAGNYYPINLGTYIKDKNTELSVLVDRSVGGSSITDGEVEIMLHRRLLYDDGRGVAEALNETVCVRDTCSGLTDDKWTNFPRPTFSAMDPSYTLPDNVAIITLQELEDRTVLLRLAHLYEVGEDTDLSVMATVELKRVFPNKKQWETSLSANQERAEMERKRLSWKVEGSNAKQETFSKGGPVDPVKLVVELAPMEIRTFIIDFNSNLVQY